jgi:probable F420-dependent oxidoreductase
MKFGIVPINVGLSSYQQVSEIAKKVEELSFESLWTFEHVMVPVSYESTYPYSSKGKMPITPETPMIDPLISLAFVAGQTTNLRLGTGVNILSQANPLYAAKQVASLDMLSNGRFLFGIGIGWLREEFDAVGVPFERRGARFEDYIAAMKKVWSGEVVEHQSDFLSWTNFKSYPLPARKPHPPLIFGGTSAKAMERIARLADGWFAPSTNLEALKPMLEQLFGLCEKHGRDPKTLEITAMWNPLKEIDNIPAYEQLGVHRLVNSWMGLGEADPIKGLEKFKGMLPANPALSGIEPSLFPLW